jgi:hypothetical protein
VHQYANVKLIMNHNGNFDPGITNNHDLIMDALRYGTTDWGFWNRSKSYTARVSEAITIEGATLKEQKGPVIVTTQDPVTKEVVKWGYDGDIMVRLPAQDPKTRQFIKAEGERLLVLRGDNCPPEITIHDKLPGSGLDISSVTFGGNFVQETGIWEPDANAFEPESQASYNLHNPLDSVQVIMDDMRVKSGLPPHGAIPSQHDAMNMYGLN